MRVLLVAGLALATLLIGYTGMLVSTLNALPFLNNWLVVALFVVSALSSGGGLLMLWAFFNQGARISHWQFRRLHHIGVALILLELLLVAALLLFAYTQGGLTWESAQQLLDGRLRYWFGFGLVLVGLLLPLFFHVVPWQKNRIARWTFAETCALVGSFCLRYCLLTAALSSAVLL
jgi:protein NrfD